MSTFDEELRRTLFGNIPLAARQYGDLNYPDDAIREIKALIKKHQPKELSVSPVDHDFSDVTAPIANSGYNQALKDSDKAYGLEE